MSERPYEPKRYEIVSVTLAGWKLPDGTIRLVSGATFPEWPKAVSHFGVVNGLTRVTDRGMVSTRNKERAGWISQEAVYDGPLDDA